MRYGRVSPFSFDSVVQKGRSSGNPHNNHCHIESDHNQPRVDVYWDYHALYTNLLDITQINLLKSAWLQPYVLSQFQYLHLDNESNVNHAKQRHSDFV